MTTITSVTAREIIDSRGNPTIEVTCTLGSGTKATASVPSGASTGSHEALELRDHDRGRYNGMGVLGAVNNVNNEIYEHVRNNAFDQEELDRVLIELDGTSNKSRLGANAILGVSLAFARAVAQEKGTPLYEHLGSLADNRNFTLPQPMFNIINGGMHADSTLDIQEFMIGPVNFGTFREKVQAAAEVISSLRKILHAKGYAIAIGDEGGFAPKLSSNEEAFELLVEAIVAAGYSTEAIKIGIDAAASTFYTENASYRLTIRGEKKNMESADMIDWYEHLVNTYPIILIEDGLAEKDWHGFTLMNTRLGSRIGIVGDDLLVTNVVRIQTAIAEQAVNSVLIKPNQIGTLTETLQAIRLAKEAGFDTFVSHRSGETEDTFIADLAVGLSCEYIKAGSLVRGERVAKYNRLMEIEESGVRV